MNNNAQAVATRAAGDNIPEFAAKYYDDDNMIHPSVVLYTDSYGYDKDYDLPGDQPSASATRAAQSGEYQYASPEELLKDTRASIHPTILSLNSKLKFDVDFKLNYFLTIDGGIKWKGVIPNPAIKKFETGFDGNFGFHPQFTIGFSKEVSLPKDKEKVKLAKFKGYTFTFMVGIIPVGSDSELKLTLSDGSTFNGCISGNITNAVGKSVSTETGTVNVTLGNDCTWTLTADTYITSLNGDTSRIKTNGHRLFVGGKEM